MKEEASSTSKPDTCCSSIDEGRQEGLLFLGSVLGPLFSFDPVLDEDVVKPVFDVFSESDAVELAGDWPFVSEDDALASLEKMVDGASDSPESLAKEYRRLFVGPFPKAAPPWGSVYTDKDQVVFGESTLALRAWLRSNSISVEVPGSDEPEDHIGTMLKILAWLASEQPQNVAAFLQDHFLTWAPHFLRLMEEVSEHPFYEGLAEISLASLDGVRSDLGLSVQEPKFYR